MSKKICPNCNHFKFEEQTDTIGVGCGTIVISAISPWLVMGATDFYGGRYPELWVLFLFAALGVFIGFVLFFKGVLFPDKEVTYKCSNCDFQQTFLKK